MRAAFLAFALAVGLGPAALPARAELRTIEVDSRQVDCVGVAPAKCLRVRDAFDQPWRLFHGAIEGFAFEPGYRYRLRVEELAVANPPADGAALRTVLREMVRKVAVEPPADPFAGKVWRLVELQAAAAGPALRPDALITLAIDTPGGRASGKGGCNNWFATAAVAGRNLKLTGMGATMMACEPPALAEERAFLDALGRVQGYEVADDGLGLTLTLAGGGRLRFGQLID
jgi:heat shock protein HslJ